MVKFPPHQQPVNWKMLRCRDKNSELHKGFSVINGDLNYVTEFVQKWGCLLEVCVRTCVCKTVSALDVIEALLSCSKGRLSDSSQWPLVSLTYSPVRLSHNLVAGKGANWAQSRLENK